MSIEGIKAAFASPVASPTQKAILVVLGHHADQDRLSAPSIATMIAGTAFSERAVRGALRALESDGLIVRHPRTGDWGETLPSIYYLAFMETRPRVLFMAEWERRV